MGTFIVIVIFVVILLGLSGNKKQKAAAARNAELKKNNPPPNPNFPAPRNETTNTIVNALMSTLNNGQHPLMTKEDDIIDVTGQSQPVPVSPKEELVKYAPGIPYWAHQYVYSYDEILLAGTAQQKFYNHFKDRFLQGNFLDLESNGNYAFILLFDLVNSYGFNRDIPGLKNHFELLGKLYPKTRTYIVPALYRKANTEEERRMIQSNLGFLSYNYTQYSYNDTPEYWKTGTKYKTQLQLKDSEVAVLNRLSSLGNNFTNIEYCFIEVIRLFLSVLEGLSEKYAPEGLAYDGLVAEVADVVLQKQFRYKYGSHNYSYGMESVSTEIYANIFKRCENIVRESYGHKRKVNADFAYSVDAAKAAFETRIVVPLVEIFPGLLPYIKAPDEATAIELFAQNTSRWKIRFDELASAYKPGNGQAFTNDIITLGKLNAKNPSVENIFFEASKFIAKTDKQQSLQLYIYYLHYDLMSAAFDNKQLTKTIQKSLFTTTEQLHDFEQVISNLVRDKDLDKALAAAATIYTPKRKKIQLDAHSIKEVELQHSGTVDLLNEYLQDDFEDDSNTIKSTSLGTEEIKIEITPKQEILQASVYLSILGLTAVQAEVLELFVKNNFTVEQSTLANFAKSKAAFTGQLVESINDSCFDHLDDILMRKKPIFI